jgi:hypothetical protein
LKWREENMSKKNAEIIEDFFTINCYINLMNENKDIANSEEFKKLIDNINKKGIRNYMELQERINIIRKIRKEREKERI